MADKYLSTTGLAYFFNRLKTIFVQKETGKGLSTNDYTTTEKTKLSNIASGAQVNVIETVKVNGDAQTVTSKAVDITVPTKLSDLTNDGNFVTDANYVHTDSNYTATEKTKLAGIEEGAEKNVAYTIYMDDHVDDADIGYFTLELLGDNSSISGSSTLTLSHQTSTSKAAKAQGMTQFGITTALNTKQDKLDAMTELEAKTGTATTARSITAAVLNSAISDAVPTKTSDLTNDSDFVSDASYVHTDNNFTATLKNKLDGVEEGAEKNVAYTIYMDNPTAANQATTYKLYADGAAISGSNNIVFANTTGKNAPSHIQGMTQYAISTALDNKQDTLTAMTQSEADTGTATTARSITAAVLHQAIANAVGQITGISFEVVTALPATGTAGVIYLLSNSGSAPNVYDEYIWVSDSFEKIGTTDVDLSNYWSMTDLTAITTAEIDTITA